VDGEVGVPTRSESGNKPASPERSLADEIRTRLISTSSTDWERGTSDMGEGSGTVDSLGPMPLPSSELTSDIFEGWCLKSCRSFGSIELTADIEDI
jgi:hypothetical protein